MIVGVLEKLAHILLCTQGVEVLMKIVARFTLRELHIDYGRTIEDIIAEDKILLVVEMYVSDWALRGTWDADLLTIDTRIPTQYFSIFALQFALLIRFGLCCLEVVVRSRKTGTQYFVVDHW